ncbi:hypothetical protein HYDPIDRAFT_99636, partial [Hydnomerulius pinastri MD-312]
ITYTFTSWTSDSMLLMPPATASDLSPLYRISVSLNLNPFSPLSCVMTVQGGGSPSAPVIGTVECLKQKQKHGTLMMEDSSSRLKNVLWNTSSPDQWRWSCNDINLRWDCRAILEDGSPMCICYGCDAASDSQLATFIPPPSDASPPLPAAILTVFPDGHQHFDHIVMSALIIERKRTLS